jgi:hypothetical protein
MPYPSGTVSCSSSQQDASGREGSPPVRLPPRNRNQPSGLSCKDNGREARGRQARQAGRQALAHRCCSAACLYRCFWSTLVVRHSSAGAQATCSRNEGVGATSITNQTAAIKPRHHGPPAHPPTHLTGAA